MKKIIILSFTFILIIICIFLYPNITSTKKIITNNQESTKINTNSLTMMYETSAGSGEYQVSSDSSWPLEGYVFNEELSSCENGSTLTWNKENKKVLLQANSSDKCYVYFDKELKIVYFADYIKDLYTSDGENGIYLHDGIGTYTNASLEAEDNSYRYAGANPNNYVCFGSEEETCPNDNLYRIIGVFDNQVKLIKHEYANSNLLGTDGDYYGQYAYRDLICWRTDDFYQGENNYDNIEAYYWNFNENNDADDNYNDNTWSTSKLNTINLNTNFLNNIGTQWADMISFNNWLVGGNTSSSQVSNIMNSNAKSAYGYEIINPANPLTYNAKVGLMYVSDYYYGASPTYWSYPGFSLHESSTNNYKDAKNDNWMFMGLFEWTITPTSNSSRFIYNIDNTGRVINDYYDDYGACIFEHNAIRPTFYLKPEVTYVSGNGSKNLPFRLKINQM